MKRFLGLPWAMVVVVAALLAVLRCYPPVRRGAEAASAASVSQQIGMKVLLITDGTDCTDSKRPRVASSIATGKTRSPRGRALPAHGDELRRARAACRCRRCRSTLGDGTQVANYEGVVVTMSGNVGLSTAQWDHAADLRAPVLGSPAHCLRGPEQRLRTECGSDGRLLDDSRPRAAPVPVVHGREHADSDRRWSSGVPLSQAG